jgi:hypothetical protein
MTEENLARLRTHRNNIHRYRGLLRTQLTDLERGFIETRTSEEMEAAKRLSNETFPSSDELLDNRARQNALAYADERRGSLNDSEVCRTNM